MVRDVAIAPSGAVAAAASADAPAAAWMARALDLARQAVGRTSPNPPVGAVIVRDGAVVGEGYTQPAGGPHAEVVALAQAGEAARGAAMVVTLEPCCHHGRTPPCTDAILAAGIAEVRFAVRDPNPRVDGGGAARLRAAGIRVVEGDGAAAAAANRIIAPFAHWVSTGRPLVTLKYAMTLDGRIATRAGSSRWISGEASRARVHAMRNVADAILVGVGTVLADDPALTTRVAGPADVRHPLRVILDSHGRAPLTARVFDPDLPGRTVVATVDMPPRHADALAARGVDVVRLLAGDDGRVALPALLDHLGRREITDLLVEGGAAVHGAFLDTGLAQRLCVFIAPKLVGGADAPGPVGGRGVDAVGAAARLVDVTVERSGEDVVVMGELTCSPAS